MGVYYSKPKRYPAGIGILSHLCADTTEELMAFAEILGMNPKWLLDVGTHKEHFDVFGLKLKTLQAMPDLECLDEPQFVARLRERKERMMIERGKADV